MRKLEEDDKYQSYASEVLSIGLIYFEFADSIREGDGHRILRCWRYQFLKLQRGRTTVLRH